MNDQVTHPDYIATGFRDMESNVLYNEGILAELMFKVPFYRLPETDRNYYHMYFKNYAVWLSHCQSKYTTEEIADTGKDL